MGPGPIFLMQKKVTGNFSISQKISPRNPLELLTDRSAYKMMYSNEKAVVNFSGGTKNRHVARESAMMAVFAMTHEAVTSLGEVSVRGSMR